MAGSDPRVRDLLDRAARAEGWVTRQCESPSEAAREVILHSVRLALIDVACAQERAEHEGLVRLVREQASPGLVVVSDRSADADAELWARQQGAWVYLPSIDESSNVSAICRQARELAEGRRQYA